LIIDSKTLKTDPQSPSEAHCGHLFALIPFSLFRFSVRECAPQSYAPRQHSCYDSNTETRPKREYRYRIRTELRTKRMFSLAKKELRGEIWMFQSCKISLTIERSYRVQCVTTGYSKTVVLHWFPYKTISKHTELCLRPFLLYQAHPLLVQQQDT
jgi:hypothetical protein